MESWIRNACALNLGLWQFFKKNQIKSDLDYSQNRASIPSEIQAKADAFRHQVITKKIEDPYTFACRVPPQHRLLTVLSLTNDQVLSARLSVNGIHTIGDIEDKGLGAVARIRGLETRYLRRLSHAMNKFLPVSDENEPVFSSGLDSNKESEVENVGSSAKAANGWINNARKSNLELWHFFKENHVKSDLDYSKLRESIPPEILAIADVFRLEQIGEQMADPFTIACRVPPHCRYLSILKLTSDHALSERLAINDVNTIGDIEDKGLGAIPRINGVGMSKVLKLSRSLRQLKSGSHKNIEAISTKLHSIMESKVEIDSSAAIKVKNVPLDLVVNNHKLVSFLTTNSFTKLGDVYGKNEQKLRSLEGIGKKKQQEISRGVNDFLNIIGVKDLKIIRHQEQPTLIFKSDPLWESIKKGFDPLVGRNKIIISKRFGLFSNKMTLQEVADGVGLTRERIRQIESKWLAKSRWFAQIVPRLMKILEERNTPLHLWELETEDEWFARFSNKQQFLKNLIIKAGGNEISVQSINGMDVISQLETKEWLNLVDEFKNSLRGYVYKRPTKSELIVLAGALATSRKCPELGEALFKASSKECVFFERESDHQPILVAYNSSTRNLTSAILQMAEEPLHYSEIHKRAEKLKGSKLDLRTVHNALPDLGAKLFGRGVYGLQEHLPVSEKKAQRIERHVKELMRRDGAERQWHSNEIMISVCQEFYLPDEFGPRALGIILKQSDAVEDLGRQVWALKGSRNTTRINIVQACITILREAGRPLSYNELRDALKRSRGLGEHFQIHPKPPLIRLQNGLWGIEGRDK